jgi:hypothetical protein
LSRRRASSRRSVDVVVVVILVAIIVVVIVFVVIIVILVLVVVLMLSLSLSLSLSLLLFNFVVITVLSSLLLSLSLSSHLAELYLLLPRICRRRHLCPLPPPPPNAIVLLFFIAFSHCTATSLVTPLPRWLVVALLTCPQSTTRHNIFHDKKHQKLRCRQHVGGVGLTRQDDTKTCLQN